MLSSKTDPATSSSTSRSTTKQSTDVTLSPPPRAEVFLVENRLNPISTRATLELTDDNLRCTVKEYSMALVEVVDGWDVHNEWRWALPGQRAI
jgi:hypothetical protein